VAAAGGGDILWVELQDGGVPPAPVVKDIRWTVELARASRRVPRRIQVIAAGAARDGRRSVVQG
jgi:hypothetical protein